MTEDQAFKVRENRLRRAAARQDLRISKARRMDPRAVDYGRYYVHDGHTNTVVAELPDIEALDSYLTGNNS